MACGCNKSLPGVGRMAVNATAAVARVAVAAVSGKQVMATMPQIVQRKTACLACDNCMVVDKNGKTYHRCVKCGCWLDGKVVSKWSLATETCPDGRWEVE